MPFGRAIGMTLNGLEASSFKRLKGGSGEREKMGILQRSLGAAALKPNSTV
jgi:hypothetical protein